MLTFRHPHASVSRVVRLIDTAWRVRHTEDGDDLMTSEVSWSRTSMSNDGEA